MIDFISPPGFPDNSPDGGGPPRRTSALAAIDRIQRRTALTEARIAALFDVAFFERMVNARREIATLQALGQPIAARTLREQLLCDLEAWLAAEPTPPRVAAPDVAFAPAGWGE